MLMGETGVGKGGKRWRGDDGWVWRSPSCERRQDGGKGKENEYGNVSRRLYEGKTVRWI